jgi:glycosyltransferase involved in cell wall biosynthesis
MQLVFISTLYNPPWGGSEALWSSAAMRALEEGHQVSVFVSEREKLESPLERLERAGACLYFWKPKYRPLNLFQRVHKKLFGNALPEWKWWHDNLPEDADVICLNQGGIFCGLMRHGLTEAILATNLPYIVLARCDTGSEFLNAKNRPSAKMFLEGASAFVAASRSTIDLVKLYLPSRMANAQALHSPITDASIKVSDYPDTDIFRFACVGRLRAADKGQAVLLACLASESWKRRPFRLTFYGEGPDKDYLRDLTSFFGLEDRVEFAGQVSDIGNIWRDAHLAIQPSFGEGSPQSLLESMLCRRACVATSVGGIPDWVQEGRSGFLAEAPTVHHLRLALERAWENRHRWREMGEAAREACLMKRKPDPAGTLLALLREAAGVAKAEMLKSGKRKVESGKWKVESGLGPEN